MQTDDPAVLEMMRRAMVARIATLSRNGRPSVTPLYFVLLNGRICLGTVEWTLAARDVNADPRVSVLFMLDQNHHDHRTLRITGRAVVRTDPQIHRSYVIRVAFKYVLIPGGLRNQLAHLRLRPLVRRYHAQSAAKGRPCVIEVSPEQAELLDAIH